MWAGRPRSLRALRRFKPSRRRWGAEGAEIWNFAREWSESTRMFGGLTAVSAQVSGVDAPSQEMWRAHIVPNLWAGRLGKVRSGLAADLGRFGETTLL